MLQGLSIQDVVLIERLDIEFRPGLSVLTGETGAGKSILLDSLGLALGARAESGLVRAGAAQLSVSALFDLSPGHAAHALLAEQALAAEDSLVLRRVVSADGRSRAFVNDQPVSVGLLRRLGDTLVEVHGQFESHGLLDPTTHLDTLDRFAGTDTETTRRAHHLWRDAVAARQTAEARIAKAKGEEEYLRHALGELEALDPRTGEEETLAEKRAGMMHGEKLLEAMNAAQAALSGKGSVEANLRTAQRSLERVAGLAGGRLEAVIAALERASVEAAEAENLLEKASSEVDLDPKALEKVEERLFALRAAARKHGTDVDGLVTLRERLAQELKAIADGSDDVQTLAAAEGQARAAYRQAAEALSAARRAGAARLDRALARELPPLKLEKARFTTAIEPLEESAWGAAGLDRVAFLVSTNPGMPAGPLGKIASGGELSRFMLALKVVLARTSSAPTLVFDEVDSGVGGAVAAAVGDRLARLAESLQVLVVTHSPQVAAKGSHHWHVAKTSRGSQLTRTSITALGSEARREEIARMLAGAEVTAEARAAADSLLAAAGTGG